MDAPQPLHGTPTTDACGVVRYRLDSPHQRAPVELRLLFPAQPPARPCLLFVLPVEPSSGSRYGDGLTVIRKLGLHDRHGLIVVAPSFNDWPWYADHPADPRRADESHLLRVVLPLVAASCPPRWRPSGPRPLLLGFSKSGWGAWTLILRHPELFGAAAVWDAPLMVDRPEPWEMPAAFGTAENFDRYRVSTLLRERANAFRAGTRLGLFGYGNFRAHHQRAHALLEELGIPHEYVDGPARAHHWESGWVPDAVAALVRMSGG